MTVSTPHDTGPRRPPQSGPDSSRTLRGILTMVVVVALSWFVLFELTNY